MNNIDIKGAIVSDDDKWIYDMFDVQSTCPKDVTDALKDSDGQGVQITINSGGGDAFSASEIYTELMDYPGEVEVRIVGVAASAATVIASAGGNVKMSPTASFMIHKAATVAMGNSEDFSHASGFLDTVDKSICTAYTNKTGMSQDEVLELMSKETWMSAEDAKEKGFIDEVMFSDQAKAVASANGALPQSVIDKVRADKHQPSNGVTVDDIKAVVQEMKAEIVSELKKEMNKDHKRQQRASGNLGRLFL